MYSLSAAPRSDLIRLIVIFIVFLSACVSRQYQAKGPIQPADFPEAFYLQALADIQNRVYRVDGNLSRILVRVQRGGVMAILGHEHIVASENVQGYILINRATKQCRADFFVPLDMLNVDDPQLRSEAELDTTPSADDIASTKNNMLKSIQAADFPFAQLRSDDCSGIFSDKNTKVILTLHGVSRERQLAISFQQTNSEQLQLSGEFSILQTEFAIEPFSVFKGLIKVENKLDLIFKLISTEIH